MRTGNRRNKLNKPKDQTDSPDRTDLKNQTDRRWPLHKAAIHSMCAKAVEKTVENNVRGFKNRLFSILHQK